MKHCKHIKKMLVLLLCFSLLATVLSTFAAYALPRSISVQNGTGERGAVAVTKTYSYRTIVNGSFDGTGLYFEADRAVTRAEAAVIVCKLMGVSMPSSTDRMA